MMKKPLRAKLTEALVRYPVSAAAACVIEQGHSTMATLGVTRLDQRNRWMSIQYLILLP